MPIRFVMRLQHGPAHRCLFFLATAIFPIPCCYDNPLQGLIEGNMRPDAPFQGCICSHRLLNSNGTVSGVKNCSRTSLADTKRTCMA